MFYQYNRGVMVPFIKRFWKVVVLAFAGIFMFTQFIALLNSVGASGGNTSETIVVKGDTTTLGGGPGWMFNRDASTDTPIEFNYHDKKIGDGSLEVLPIDANPSDKFVGELFMNRDIKDVKSIEYWFKINGASSDANEFYLNVYTWFDDTPDYYDCRFDYVPTDNGNTNWRSFKVDMDDEADVVKEKVTNTCPDSPAEMPEGSRLFFFAINTGDGSSGDENVGGHYDKVIVKTKNENDKTHTVTYDFEPVSYVEDGKIKLCHATGSDQNPYEYNNISLNGVNGHKNHDGDIIPPNPKLPDGMNWTEQNISLWEENCGDGEVLGDETDHCNYDWLKANTSGGSVLQRLQELQETGEKCFNVEVVQECGYLNVLPNDIVRKNDDTDGFNYAAWHQLGDLEPLNTEINGESYASLPLNFPEDYNGGSVTVNWKIFGTENDYVSLWNSSGSVEVDTDCQEPEEPEVPSVTLVANKIICDDEAKLPNLGGGGPDITNANFAQDWVAQKPGCQLIENWDYQYRLSDEASEPSGSHIGPLDGWTTFTNTTSAELDGNTTIQLREVLPAGYIPFTGWTSQDNVSAEFYCNTDVANYDNWEWISSPQDGATYYCVGWNVKKPVTVKGTKIVCDTEDRLPNWGNGQDGPASIDAATADTWLAQGDNAEHCDTVAWDFQWKMDPTDNPGDNTGVADGWQTFDAATGAIISPAQQGDSNRIWVREVWNDQYIPFTGQNTVEDISAEIYCHNDVLNYDNWDFIDNPQPGETYYCVAWNVLKPTDFQVHASKVICDTEEDLPNWGEGDADITSATAQEWVTQSQGACRLADWEFQWSPDNVGNPGDNLGEQSGDWTTFSGTVTLPVNAAGDGNKVWFREVAHEDYIPFTGEGTTEDVSAEFYCNNDVLNYDNWEWIENPAANADYYCVGFNVLKPVTLSATKIECTSEEFLPNWGDGSHGPINESTADTFLASVNPVEGDPVCEKVEWSFQWNTGDSADPDDNAGDIDGWNDFNTTATIWLDEQGTNDFRVREVFNESYIPFTGQNTDQSVSAEIYCSTDVLHYDNWEWIDSVQPGETYHCVAWNVPINGQISGLVYEDENQNETKDPTEPVLENRTVWLLTHNSPWILKAIETTDTGGNYLFDNLAVPGTYYVCQDVESEWFQTQLNLAGQGGLDIGSAVVGDQIGGDSDPGLDALIADFCYAVTLTPENPISENNDFGNFIPQSLGDSTTKDTEEGVVLAETTDGEVLADTGNPIVLPLILGASGILLVAVLTLATKKRAHAKYPATGTRR